MLLEDALEPPSSNSCRQLSVRRKLATPSLCLATARIGAGCLAICSLRVEHRTDETADACFGPIAVLQSVVERTQSRGLESDRQLLSPFRIT